MEDGRSAHNVLHASYSGPFHGSTSEANAILTGLNAGTQWTAFAAFLAAPNGILSVTIRDLNVVDAPLISSTIGGQAGTSASPSLPNEVALVVTLRTASTGPQNRGRMFIPNLATNALGTGNVVAAGALTAVNNWASIISGVLSASGYNWGIGHYHRLAYTGAGGRLHPERAAGIVPITTVTVRDNHRDTQRRRGLK